MIQGFYSAKSSLKFRQTKMDVISDNLSNINTDGYKKNTANFQEALNIVLKKEYPSQGEMFYSTGTGTFLESMEKDFSQGDLKDTGNSLDLAIEGPGFLGLSDSSGRRYYSRGGSFTLSVPNEEGFLNIVDTNGYFLLNKAGQKLKIPADAADISIEKDGFLELSSSEDSSNGQNIMVVDFHGKNELASIGRGLYGQTIRSGVPVAASEADIVQGALEMSNVDMAEEMTNLIMNQRIFQLNSKIIQTADEMESMANSLRK
jgi:flagellar basal-body rod protein FlgG